MFVWSERRVGTSILHQVSFERLPVGFLDKIWRAVELEAWESLTEWDPILEPDVVTGVSRRMRNRLD